MQLRKQEEEKFCSFFRPSFHHPTTPLGLVRPGTRTRTSLEIYWFTFNLQRLLTPELLSF